MMGHRGERENGGDYSVCVCEREQGDKRTSADPASRDSGNPGIQKVVMSRLNDTAPSGRAKLTAGTSIIHCCRQH